MDVRRNQSGGTERVCACVCVCVEDCRACHVANSSDVLETHKSIRETGRPLAQTPAYGDRHQVSSFPDRPSDISYFRCHREDPIVMMVSNIDFLLRFYFL